MEDRSIRIKASAYASLLAIVAMVLAFTFFSLIGLKDMLPFYKSLVMAMLTAALVGGLLGRSLLYPKTLVKGFLTGALLILLSLPIFDLSALYFMLDYFKGTDALHHYLKEYALLYEVILIYSLIFVGSWLAILCGLTNVCLQRLLGARRPA